MRLILTCLESPTNSFAGDLSVGCFSNTLTSKSGTLSSCLSLVKSKVFKNDIITTALSMLTDYSVSLHFGSVSKDVRMTLNKVIKLTKPSTIACCEVLAAERVFCDRSSVVYSTWHKLELSRIRTPHVACTDACICCSASNADGLYQASYVHE